MVQCECCNSILSSRQVKAVRLISRTVKYSMTCWLCVTARRTAANKLTLDHSHTHRTGHQRRKLVVISNQHEYVRTPEGSEDNRLRDLPRLVHYTVVEPSA